MGKAPIEYRPNEGLSQSQRDAVKTYFEQLNKDKEGDAVVDFGNNIDWLIELVDCALRSHAKEQSSSVKFAEIDKRLAAIFELCDDLISYSQHDLKATPDIEDDLSFRLGSMKSPMIAKFLEDARATPFDENDPFATQRSLDSALSFDSAKRIVVIESLRVLAWHPGLVEASARGRPTQDTQTRRLVRACYHYGLHQRLEMHKHVQKGDWRARIGQLIYAVAGAFGIAVTGNEIGHAYDAYHTLVEKIGQSKMDDFTSICAGFPPAPVNSEDLSEG